MKRKKGYSIVKPQDMKVGQVCYMVGCCLHRTKKSADRHLKELQKAGIKW